MADGEVTVEGPVSNTGLSMPGGSRLYADSCVDVFGAGGC